MASKYYLYSNASRRIKVGKYTFAFDVFDQFAGAWRGVLEIQDKKEQEALESVAKKLGIEEISKQDYDFFVPTVVQQRLASRGKSIRQVQSNRGSGRPAVTVGGPKQRQSSAVKKSVKQANPNPALESVLNYANVTAPKGI